MLLLIIPAVRENTKSETEETIGFVVIFLIIGGISIAGRAFCPSWLRLYQPLSKQTVHLPVFS